MVQMWKLSAVFVLPSSLFIYVLCSHKRSLNRLVLAVAVTRRWLPDLVSFLNIGLANQWPTKTQNQYQQCLSFYSSDVYQNSKLGIWGQQQHQQKRIKDNYNWPNFYQTLKLCFLIIINKNDKNSKHKNNKQKPQQTHQLTPFWKNFKLWELRPTTKTKTTTTKNNNNHNNIDDEDDNDDDENFESRVKWIKYTQNNSFIL